MYKNKEFLLVRNDDIVIKLRDFFGQKQILSFAIGWKLLLTKSCFYELSSFVFKLRIVQNVTKFVDQRSREPEVQRIRGQEARRPEDLSSENSRVSYWSFFLLCSYHSEINIQLVRTINTLNLIDSKHHWQ